MDDIDFLSNKGGGGDHKKENKKKAEEEIKWSKSDEDNSGSKKSPAGFLSFFGKSKVPDERSNNLVSKSKLMESRREILKLIKQQENDNEITTEATKTHDWPSHNPEAKRAVKTDSHGLMDKKIKFNFSSWLNYKLGLSGLVNKIKKKKYKEMLIDYQRVFRDEKEKKKNVKPAAQIENEARGRNNEKQEKPFFALASNKKHENLVEKGAYKTEDKVQKKIEKREEISDVTRDKDGESVDILKTNLIKGEVITFFDWRKKVIILINAIIFACLIISLVYGGLLVSQEQKELENRDFIKKFNELESEIKEAEKDINNILIFQKKLKTVKELLVRHIYWTNFFKFLEDNTLSEVYYSNFVGDTKGNYTLSAIAKDYDTISQQVRVMRNSDKVIQVGAGGGEMTQQEKNEQGAIKFNLELSVKPEIFTE